MEHLTPWEAQGRAPEIGMVTLCKVAFGRKPIDSGPKDENCGETVSR